MVMGQVPLAEAAAGDSDAYPLVVPSHLDDPPIDEINGLPGVIVALSTDGRYVLWVHNPASSVLNVTILSDLGTGEATQLGDWQRRGVAMSGDGRYVILQEWLPAFPDTHERLYRLDLVTGVETLIADSVALNTEHFRYVDISDTGAYVAFINYLDETNNFGPRRRSYLAVRRSRCRAMLVQRAPCWVISWRRGLGRLGG